MDGLAAKAFNRGSDARIAGTPFEQNPYVASDGLRAAWETGWRHVNKSWGKLARWQVMPLVSVRAANTKSEVA